MAPAPKARGPSADEGVLFTADPGPSPPRAPLAAPGAPPVAGFVVLRVKGGKGEGDGAAGEEAPNWNWAEPVAVGPLPAVPEPKVLFPKANGV